LFLQNLNFDDDAAEVVEKDKAETTPALAPALALVPVVTAVKPFSELTLGESVVEVKKDENWSDFGRENDFMVVPNPPEEWANEDEDENETNATGFGGTGEASKTETVTEVSAECNFLFLSFPSFFSFLLFCIVLFLMNNGHSYSAPVNSQGTEQQKWGEQLLLEWGASNPLA
jgi:hypothetical protein